MTITIAIDDNLNQADLNLDVEADPNDSTSLLVSYDNQPLPDLPNQESLYVDCFVGQCVRFIVTDFEHPAGQTWTLSASPLTRETNGGSWSRNGSTAYDEDDAAWPHGNDHQSVTLTATTQTAAGETKKRKRVIRVKMLTSNPQPSSLNSQPSSHASGPQSSVLE